MKKHNIASLSELSSKSKNDLSWFWKSVDEDIGIVWVKEYSKVLDSSNEIQWTRWFVDGKTNIYKSPVEKFAKNSPQKIAFFLNPKMEKPHLSLILN